MAAGDATDAAIGALSAKLKSAKEVRAGFTAKARYPDGTYVATAAASNNFGAPSKGIPPRPFFTIAVNNGKKTWGAMLGKFLQIYAGDARQALQATGAEMAGDMAESLIDLNGPPLSQVTLLLRERFPDRVGMTFGDVMQARRDVAGGMESSLSGTGAKPLVWTGVMLQTLQGPGAVEVR